MTIECYFGEYPKHSIHESPNDGPFCYEVECLESEETIKTYREKLKVVGRVPDSIFDEPTG